MKKYFSFLALCTFLFFMCASAVPKLSSFPTARATIFLDFDGHYVTSGIWNEGNPLNCAPSGMNDGQVTEIFNRVSEDYRPFDLDITTDSLVFLAAPLTKRMRIIVTTTSAWYPGVGGVAFVGSFTWGDDTPGFVFSDRLGPFNAKYIAESCSHESGHTVGLSHQSTYDGNCELTATYNIGDGTGETGWAPIMGNSYYKNHTGWSNGPTPGGCNFLQDNLIIITTNNGFGYRPDDYSDDPNNNPALITIADKAFSKSGIITTTGDKDVFRLDITEPGSIHLSALPFSVGPNDNGADLDIKITLLDSFMQPVNVFNPFDLLNVTIDTTLNTGRYYVVLDGTGNSFSSSYGSLGSYTISGTFTALSVLSVNSVSLYGKADNGKHNLSWNIIANGLVKSVCIESSTDGTHFKSLINAGNSANNFSYNPFIKTDIFYRLKVASITGQTVYSNIIVLKSTGKSFKPFVVSTLVHDGILVNALEKYTYVLSEVSGRIISKHAMAAGMQSININNFPNGIYIMQVIGQNERITERIIKQ